MEISGLAVSIAPQVRTWLGSGPKTSVASDPVADLEANILVLLPPEARPFLLVSIDALYPGPNLRSNLEARLAPWFSPAEIFLAASHTHNAPMLDETKPFLGMLVEEHLDYVVEKIVAGVKKVMGTDFQTVDVKFWEYSVTSVISRRRFLPVVYRESRLLLMQDHFLKSLRSPKGVSGNLVEFWSCGTLVAVLWIHPCHPVAYPDEQEVSGDYVADIRRRLREMGTPPSGLPIVFMQGASGELRPPAFVKEKNPLTTFLMQMIGQRLGRFEPAAFANWCDAVWSEIMGTRKLIGVRSADSTENPVIVGRRSTVPLAQLYRNQSVNGRNLSFHSLHFGPLTIVGISAEPTWDFFVNLQAQCSQEPRNLALVGCIDDTFGYLASRRQVRRKGYEVDGFEQFFSVSKSPNTYPQAVIHSLLMDFLSPS